MGGTNRENRKIDINQSRKDTVFEELHTEHLQPMARFDLHQVASVAARLITGL